MKKLKIVVFISGQGSNLQALIANQGLYEISAVLSNKPNAYGLTYALDADIKTYIDDCTTFNAFDAIVESLNVDLIVLAGFMRILPNWFTQKYQGKMINIHPSLLPKYKGLNTHKRALENCDQEHGCTVHSVTADLDDGPILMQAKLTIAADDTIDTLKDKVQKLEHELYYKVINKIANKEIRL